MIYLLDNTDLSFPDPEEAEPEGILAVGGDLSPARLINAYRNGIFPWFNDGDPILWWSPNPRMVLFPNEFRYSKSLQRVVRSGKYQVRIDTNFKETIRHCSTTDRSRQGQKGTWITKSMTKAYVRLHELGLAHSFETYCDSVLVGGLYGVSLGPFFFGESMFHIMPDASKVAFVRLVEFCTDHHFRLIDAQQETPHLASLGARAIPRSEYLTALNVIRPDNTLQGNWGNKKPCV